MKHLISYIIPLLFALYANHSVAQDETYQTFGEEFARIIMEKDSIAFEQLIIPKSAILKMAEERVYQGFTEPEIKLALKRIDENYESLFVSNYKLSYFFAMQMTELRQIDLGNTAFRQIDNNTTQQDSSLIAIQGDTKNKEFPYFTFYLTEVDEEYYLANSDFMISEVNPLEDVDFIDCPECEDFE